MSARTTKASRAWLGVRTSLAFAIGLGLGSCDDLSPEEFNEDVAYLVCEINRTCDGSISGGVLDSLPSDFRCEDDLMARFDSCGTQCRYREAAARRCLKRLEKVLDDCEGRNLRPCRKAYADCDESCNLWNCSVDPNAPRHGGVVALALLGLGWLRRRPGPPWLRRGRARDSGGRSRPR